MTMSPSSRPEWLRVKVKTGGDYELLVRDFKANRLTTVCQESGCPNIWDCFSRREATFMMLGSVCTRTCRYCRVQPGRPDGLDEAEPSRVAGAAVRLGLRDIVITSVTRDDLTDGGASVFGATVRAVKRAAPGCRVEVLIPDFKGDWRAVKTVVDAGPDTIGHNLETVPRLFPDVRPQADYRRSLRLLRRLAASGQDVKTGLIVGLGETRAEVRGALRDAATAGVKTVVIGQYLAPSPLHHPVARWWRPPEFMGLAKYAQGLGFKRVISGPLVRSSWRGSLSRSSAGGCSS